MRDGKGIDERLDRRTHLALALLGHVVFEIAVIRTADVSFHISRRRVDRHERCPENLFVVENRIVRGHSCITFALVREDLHFDRFFEFGHNLLVRCPVVFECAVTVGLAHRIAHDAVDLILAYVVEQAFGRPYLTVHRRLDLLAHVSHKRILGVLLHRRVDRRINFQTVPVEVVGRTVGFDVLDAPAIQRIGIPLFNGLIVIPFVQELVARGALCGHHHAQHLAEIGSRTLVVRYRMVVQVDRQGLQRIALMAVDISLLLHPRNYQVAPCEGPVGILHRTVTGGLVHDSDQHRRLLCVEFRGEFIEESAGGGFDAVRVAAVLHRIEIHRYNLLFGIVPLEHDGCNPLFELRNHQLRSFRDRIVVCRGIARVEVLGQLLRDRTAAALSELGQCDRTYGHTRQGDEIYTRMGIKTHVFG